MRYLITLLSVCFLSSGAWAGEYGNGNGGGDSNASARAAALAVGVGIAGASGGAASASSGEGDSLYLNIPGAASVGAAGAHRCGLSSGWSIPIFTYNAVSVEPLCQLIVQTNAVCALARRVDNREITTRCGELALQLADYGKPEQVATASPTKITQTASAGGKDKDDLACVFGWGLKHLDC